MISLAWFASNPCSAFFDVKLDQPIESVEGYRFHSNDQEFLEILSMDFISVRKMQNGTSCANLTKSAYESELKVKFNSLGKIEENMAVLTNFVKLNPELIDLFPKEKISISFRPRCDRISTLDSASPVIVRPNCGISSRKHCVDFSFYIPDFSQIESQPNILYHEIGHIIFRNLMTQLKTASEPAIQEAFADFFAYSVSKDPVMGTYYDDKTKQTRVIRKMKSSFDSSKTFDSNQDWGFNKMNTDEYAAGSKFRDALILISERQGFSKSLEILKNVIARANEIRSLDPGPGYDKNVACLEQACREVFVQYFD
jgi:hypothetical protein